MYIHVEFPADCLFLKIVTNYSTKKMFKKLSAYGDKKIIYL